MTKVHCLVGEVCRRCVCKVTSGCRVVICGAGIIGSAIAYYLAIKGVAATVVERASVACASSGIASFPSHDTKLVASHESYGSNLQHGPALKSNICMLNQLPQLQAQICVPSGPRLCHSRAHLYGMYAYPMLYPRDSLLRLRLFCAYGTM